MYKIDSEDKSLHHYGVYQTKENNDLQAEAYQ